MGKENKREEFLKKLVLMFIHWGMEFLWISDRRPVITGIPANDKPVAFLPVAAV